MIFNGDHGNYNRSIDFTPAMDAFHKKIEDVRRCIICAEHLPLGPRPVFQLNQDARILIAGQAPGRKVHESGVPFADASGDRLREWLGLDRNAFYDETKVAILPMGFCYPGTGKSGDFPPRPECAPKWRESLLSELTNVRLTLVIGKYAMDYHLPSKGQSLTETVQNWRSYWPLVVPMPHPSPRNNIWIAKNPWFTTELLPLLRKQVIEVLRD